MSNNEFELAQVLLAGSLSLEGFLLVTIVYVFSARNTGMAPGRHPDYIKNLLRLGKVFVFVLFINTICSICSFLAVYICNLALFCISIISFLVSVISIPIWALLILFWEK